MDASLEHVKVVDCPFDNQVPWLDSSYFFAAVSALGEHLDNGVVAYIDLDHCALDDADVEVYDSSFHFDTLSTKKNVLKNRTLEKK